MNKIYLCVKRTFSLFGEVITVLKLIYAVSLKTHKLLEEIEKHQLATKAFWNMDELVRHTGISRSTLYKWHARGIIPGYKPMGKLLIFERAAVEAWLLVKAKSEADQIEQEAIDFINSKQKTVRWDDAA